MMGKNDIAKNSLYIHKIINVIKARIQNSHRLLHTDNRYSDAFVYIIAGSCIYKFDDGFAFTVNKGDIVYLAYHSVYTMHLQTENYQFIFCDFEFDEASDRKSNVYSPKNASDAENLFYKLLKSHTSASKTSFTECMSILYRIYGMVLLTSNVTYIGTISENRILEAKKYIDTNFKNNSLSVAFLAAKASMSEVYFRKLFKSQYGVSPSQYIHSVRLKKAKELMSYHFFTLEECALQSGFSSLQYFCRVFKKNTGITPSKYRNQKE